MSLVFNGTFSTNTLDHAAGVSNRSFRDSDHSDNQANNTRNELFNVDIVQTISLTH